MAFNRVLFCKTKWDLFIDECCWFYAVLNHDSWARVSACFWNWESAWFHLVIPNGYRMMMPHTHSLQRVFFFSLNDRFNFEIIGSFVLSLKRYVCVCVCCIVAPLDQIHIESKRLYDLTKASFELPNHFVIFVKWLCSLSWIWTEKKTSIRRFVECQC